MRPLSSCLLLCFVAIASAAAHAADDAQRAKDATIVRTLLRLPGIDLSTKPEAKAALLRHLEAIRGSEQYVEIAEKFKLRECAGELLKLAADEAGGALAVKAATVLLKMDERDLLAKAIADPDPIKAARIVSIVGLTADSRANDLLAPLVVKGELSLVVRAGAVTALGRNAPGQKELLALVEQGKLPADLQFAAANALLSSADEGIRTAAGKHLTLPAAAGGQPLPPLGELVQRSGDAERGKALFATTGTCAKCHKVRGEGKDVGPDLSEIGSKLSKEAMYISILDPSAGVSVNYETWLARTVDGTTISGVLVSQTDDAIELKTAEAIVHKLQRDDLDGLKKQTISLMPADLQKQLQAQDLVDIVEYLTTLKKTD
jgi:putative heme-binding domain-containing protein